MRGARCKQHLGRFAGQELVLGSQAVDGPSRVALRHSNQYVPTNRNERRASSPTANALKKLLSEPAGLIQLEDFVLTHVKRVLDSGWSFCLLSHFRS